MQIIHNLMGLWIYTIFNILARANYTNLQKGIYENRGYLVKFLRNLLLNENNRLENKELHIVSTSPVVNEPRKIKVLSLLKNNPTMKTEELAKELSISLRTAKSIIAVLKKDEKLARVGGKKHGHWEVKH